MPNRNFEVTRELLIKNANKNGQNLRVKKNSAEYFNAHES